MNEISRRVSRVVPVRLFCPAAISERRLGAFGSIGWDHDVDIAVAFRRVNASRVCGGEDDRKAVEGCHIDVIRPGAVHEPIQIATTATCLHARQRAKSGERGIRTLGAREGSAVFKTAALNRSAISPGGREAIFTDNWPRPALKSTLERLRSVARL